MAYGFVFALVAILLALEAVRFGGWLLILLWPAISFSAVAAPYLGAGPRVFGKQPIGTLSVVSTIILLPFLFYTWIVWHALRFFSREPAMDRVTPRLLIGRRLLSGELPDGVQVVVDLTAEFAEPRALRSVATYLAHPMLDGLPINPQKLTQLAHQLAAADGQIFIHCAQGHGRTGLVAAAYLVATGHAASAKEAIAIVQAARPLATPNRAQRAALQDTVRELTASRKH